jgi:biopolymer transport protein ExbD
VDRGVDVLVVVLVVTVVVSVVVEVEVDVVVPGTSSGPYFRIKPWSLTIHPSSAATMSTDRRRTAIVGGSGSVATTFQVNPSQ